MLPLFLQLVGSMIYEQTFPHPEATSNRLIWHGEECRWDQTAEREPDGELYAVIPNDNHEANLMPIKPAQFCITLHYIWHKVGPMVHIANQQPKSKRRQFDAFQTVELERQFCVHRYLTRNRKEELSRSTFLTERQVEIWFQNRRAKHKRQMKDAIERGQHKSDSTP